MNTEHILAAFRAVAAARNWEPLHSPRNLATAATIEMGELLALFQWQTADRDRAREADPRWRSEVAAEVADIFMYLVALCDALQIDPEQALNEKIAANNVRFGVVETVRAGGGDAEDRAGGVDTDE